MRTRSAHLCVPHTWHPMHLLQFACSIESSALTASLCLCSMQLYRHRGQHAAVHMCESWTKCSLRQYRASAACNTTGIEASRLAKVTPGMAAPATNCSAVGTGNQALAYWGINVGPGEIIGILLAFYFVLHVFSYLALSQLHKQKR